MKVLVAGAGGFIGGHLTERLVSKGFQVVAVDIKEVNHWYKRTINVEEFVGDLRNLEFAYEVVKGVNDIYNLAADMGGMGFIENNKAACMLSVQININLLLASRDLGVNRFFFASSACVYAKDHQNNLEVCPLREDDAYPAMPEDGYGWEKLFSERMCRHFREDFGLKTRIARFHNVYGPFGTFRGGREKAPAAICRKVIEAQLSGNHQIEIWGDGQQLRSFMWIDDCVKGIEDVMNSEYYDPVNLGSAETVSINGLVDIVEEIAGVKLNRQYNLNAPQGVRARTSDNTLFRSLYHWEPNTSLKVGLETTYNWIYNELVRES